MRRPRGFETSQWRMVLIAGFAAVLLVVVWVAMVDVPQTPRGVFDETFLSELEAWRQQRDESLRREDGWLSLVGLFWLEKEESVVGSAPESDVLLPEGKAAPVAGRIVLAGGEARFEAAPGGGVEHDGRPVESLALASDAGGEPTVLATGDLRFYLIERAGRLGVRVKDTRSPTLLGFQGMESFPADRSYRVVARFEPYEPPRQIPVPNILGTVEDQTSWGAVVFELEGESLRLDALAEPGDEELFLVFGDATSGRETYGGGRFLYARAPGPDGRVVLDFNQAYNPPCVFTPYATCPLPPRQNRLPVRVPAGEKTWAAAAH